MRPTFPAFAAIAACCTLLPVACLLVVTPGIACAQTYNISTFAGGALPVNLPGTSASLFGPQSAVAVDATGNVFFVDGNTVLRLDAVSGVLTLAAGNGTAGYSGDNGPAISAQLHNPYGLAVDSAGNLYISSATDSVVREVSSGVITTLVGTGVAGYSGDNGPAVSAQLNAPYGLAVDASGNLYIADYGNNVIREVSGGTITTVAGTGIPSFGGDNGPPTSAELNGPRAVAVDASGNLYIADTGNSRIRRILAGQIGTVAGNGVAGFSGDGSPGVVAEINLPCAVAIDSNGNLFIADYFNNRVRKVTNGIITTVAGKGTAGFSGDSGAATNAQLNNPFVVAVDFAGNLYIGDYGNNRIREVSSGTITTVAGNGTQGFGGDGGSAVSAQLHYPYGAALDSSGNVYIADARNNRIRKVSAGVIATVGGNGTAGFTGDAGSPVAAELNQPSSVALDSTGNIYIVDSGNNRIRKISGGVITTVAGNGTAGFSGDGAAAISAELNGPTGIAVDSTGNLYIADATNNRVRKVSAAGTITTVAGTGIPSYGGDGGSATSAFLHNPSGVAVDSSGNLYIADSGNNRIRKVSSGTISTVAGTGVAGFTGDGAAATSAQLSAPGGVAMSAGGSLYIADTGNNCVRRVSGGTINTVAGGGATLGDGGLAVSGDLGSPQSIALDAAGDVYVADTQDNRIRLLSPLPLSIGGPSSLPPATVGVAYAGATLTAAGGAGGYTWTATGLPRGFTISTAGVLTGTGTAVSTSTPQFTVKDSAAVTVSTTLTLTIANPVPTITSTNPASVTANGATFTLTVTGTGFVAGAVISWNGSPLATRVVSGTQLTASVLSSSIGPAGTVPIVVTSGGTSSASFSFTVNPPPPALSSISPTSTPATGAAFTLTLAGTGFAAADTVSWAGSPIATTFVSATQLTAQVTSTLIASAGTASVLVNAGSVSTTALTFTIGAPPAITALAPAFVIAGAAGFTLKVTGTGFANGAAVQWNGAPLTSTFASATSLTAAVPAGLIAMVGSATVAVSYLGATSNTMTFPVNTPPAITTLSPAAATAGGAAFTLTVTGTGFVSGAAVDWNGTAVTTKFVSATELTASVAASQIVNTGSVNVVVSSAGATSSPAVFTVNPPPVVTGLNPASVTGTGEPFTLTVNGSGFVSGATVAWNGTALTTTFVSATQLTAAVPANLAVGAGSVGIVVTNPSGASTSAIKLSISAALPSVTTGGVVPIYSSVPVIQPGSWISIYGTGLASGVSVWNGNYPTALGGTSVTINNKSAYLWSVSPTQINLQAPNDTATGTVNVVVKTSAGSTASTVTLAAYGPSFSLFPGSNYAGAVIPTPNGAGAYGGGTYDLLGPVGQFGFNTRPVNPGEILVLYGVGFGPTTPAVPAGKAFTGIAPTTNPVTLTIGGTPAKVLFSGMTQSGVFQINLIVPEVGSGDQPLLATVGGVQTPSNVLVTVH